MNLNKFDIFVFDFDGLLANTERMLKINFICFYLYLYSNFKFSNFNLFF